MSPNLCRILAVPLAPIAVALSFGCSASMVSRPGSTTPNPNAPVNEASRPGVVKYNNGGLASIRQSRRNDAYRQMHEACGGPYRIDAEGPRVEGGVVVPAGDAVVVSDTEYWYIQFSCVRDPTAK